MRRGVTLRQYAAMHAAMAVGAARPWVLTVAGIPESLWNLGEMGWMDRLADEEGEETPLQTAYDAHLAEAQTRFARVVKPYDEDLRAWLDFVRIWSATEDQMAVLGILGLFANDVMHLHRTWSGRLEREPALQRQALQILQEEPLCLMLPVPQVSPPLVLPAPEPGEELLPSAEEAERLEAEERAAKAEQEEGEEAEDEEAVPVFAPLPGSDGADEVAPVKPPAPSPKPPIAPSAAPASPPAAPSVPPPAVPAPPPPVPSAPPPAPTAVPPRPAAAEPSSPPSQFNSYLEALAKQSPASVPPPVLAGGRPSAAPAPSAQLVSHAKMSAELAAFPTRAKEVLARYGVSSPEQQQALDDWWRATQASSPDQDAVWWDIYTRHHEQCVRRR